MIQIINLSLCLLVFLRPFTDLHLTPHIPAGGQLLWPVPTMWTPHRIESMLMKRFFRSRPVPAPRQTIERASNISTTIWDGRRDMVICFGIITHRRKGLRHYQLDNLQLYTSCELNLCCSVTLFRCAPKS